MINGTTPVSDLRGNTKEGDTVQVSFTVAAGAAPQRFTLVSYTAPGPKFDANTASQQKIFDTDTGVFGPGSYTLTVSNPHSYFQVDFVGGYAIDRLGPANSNIFYSAQNRLFSADNCRHARTSWRRPASLTGTVYRDANNNGVDRSGRTADSRRQSDGNCWFDDSNRRDRHVWRLHVRQPAGRHLHDHRNSARRLTPTARTRSATRAARWRTTSSAESCSPPARRPRAITLASSKRSARRLPATRRRSIAWWNGSTGQALIKALNGGQTAKNLGNWLAANYNNLFGANAGSANNLAGKTNAQVAAYYQSLYANAARKPEAETLALALSVYVTNSGLAGTTATSYGFAVSAAGLGAATVNVGANGAAFGVNNNTVLTITELLSRANVRARKGLVWDANANGSLSTAESVLRSQISSLFVTINNT